MSAASEALADVRGWLCDNLNAGDAGKVCGMLSVVSRHITELEFKNAELLQDRDLFRELFDLTTQPDRYVQVRDENAKLREQVTRLQSDWESEHDYANQMEVKEKMAVAENAELRKLARGLNWCTENAKVPSAECECCPLGDTENGELSCEKMMRELGVEVDNG